MLIKRKMSVNWLIFASPTLISSLYLSGFNQEKALLRDCKIFANLHLLKHRQSTHLVHPARGLEEGAVGSGAREAAWQQLAGGGPLLLVLLALAHGAQLLAVWGLDTD